MGNLDDTPLRCRVSAKKSPAAAQRGTLADAVCSGQGDILAVEQRFELDRSAGVAELLDLGEELVELLGVAHGKAQQRIELSDDVVMADDGTLRSAEIAEFVILVRLEGDGDEAPSWAASRAARCPARSSTVLPGGSTTRRSAWRTR